MDKGGLIPKKDVKKSGSAFSWICPERSISRKEWVLTEGVFLKSKNKKDTQVDKMRTKKMTKMIRTYLPLFIFPPSLKAF
jgi:hypothetical protein